MNILIFTLGKIAQYEGEQSVFITKAQNEMIRKDIKEQLKNYDIVPLFIFPEVSNIDSITIKDQLI